MRRAEGPERVEPFRLRAGAGGFGVGALQPMAGDAAYSHIPISRLQ
jgi:hypothetical protein